MEIDWSFQINILESQFILKIWSSCYEYKIKSKAELWLASYQQNF